MLKALAVLGIVAVAGVAAYQALPARGRELAPPLADVRAPVRGAIHVHTARSDGTGSVDDVAAAAARAGLQFVVLTDHGDGTREPDPPAYRHGVLCIDAVEITTQEGHLVALGLPEAPYPLGGEARDVLEDVARLGGFGIAAHPESTRPGLRWTSWDTEVAGIEWLNADSEWRDESAGSLARAMFSYPFRSIEAVASLLDRPAAALARWDALTKERRVVGLAGSDAHARLGFRSLGEPYDGNSLHVPSYEQMFRVFSNALTDVTLTGDAAADAAAVLAAVTAGHLYSSIDAAGGAAAMSFTAESGGKRAGMGDILPLAGPVTLRVQVQAPPDVRLDLVRNGSVMEGRTGSSLELTETGSAAVYRIEVSLPGGPGEPPIPWMVSNPIYTGRAEEEAAPSDTRPRATTFVIKYGDGPATGWEVETSPAALGAIDVIKAARGTQLSLRYAIGGAASASPYAAFVMPAGADLAAHDRITFVARANAPMRLSVQVREPGAGPGERWHRSVYIDPEPRDITVYFDDLRPRGASRSRPALSNVQAILFVVDTVNTALGGNGTIWIDDVRYGR